jgi:HEAT repeat protein
LADLESTNQSVQLFALQRLQRPQPGPDPNRQAEVAAILMKHAKGNDALVAGGAARALVVWATENEVPELLNWLDETNNPRRNSAIAALGRLKVARAAEPLAARLETGDRKRASQALQDIGTPAEQAVIPYLRNKDKAVRREACYILKIIGTTASAAALEPLTSDKDKELAQAARAALQAVKQRP